MARSPSCPTAFRRGNGSSPTGSCGWRPARRWRSSRRKGKLHEHRRTLHPPSRHDDSRHGRDPPLRRHGISPPSDLRPAQRGLSDDPGLGGATRGIAGDHGVLRREDRKSTRLNSSHVAISYAVFCLKKKKKKPIIIIFSKKK